MNEKLIQLADYLENEVPDDKFDMSQWGSECGTIACALGWGTRIFSGLELMPWDGDDTGIKFTDAKGIEHHGMYAGSVCFDITYSKAEWLFLDNFYDDPAKEKVVERIRQYALHSQ